MLILYKCVCLKKESFQLWLYYENDMYYSVYKYIFFNIYIKNYFWVNYVYIEKKNILLFYIQMCISLKNVFKFIWYIQINILKYMYKYV